MPGVGTYFPSIGDVKVKWHSVDADGQVLGRLATQVATLLRGKHKPEFTPFLNLGDHVIVLNAAKLGAPLKATVTFHGDLSGVQPKKGVIQGDILVCQGGADQFVPEAARAAFKKSMDSVGARYSFIVYPGAMHAFSNPNATALGEKFKLPIAYNASADSASWKDMQTFFLTALK